MPLTANTVEMTFIFIAIAVILCSSFALREALMDEAWVSARSLNGPLKVIADQNIREELFRIGIGAIMLGAAALSLYFPPPPPTYRQMPQVLVTMTAWCLVGGLMIAQSVTAIYVKRKLKQYADAEPRRRRKEDEPTEPQRRRDDLAS